MIFDKLFTNNVISESSMQAMALRNDVILNNIANADTPKYKAKSVNFEGYLRDAIDSSRLTGKLDLSSVKPSIQTQHKNYKVRLDENDVDAETELINFYKNASRYDVVVNGVINSTARLNTVLTSIR